jgi:hypothetical protein
MPASSAIIGIRTTSSTPTNTSTSAARGLAFRFGGDFHALWGAYAAAAAYAKATEGVVFDSESGEVLPPDKAIAAARGIERDLPNLLARS